MSYSSVEAHAKEYFWSLSPLAKRVASDVAAARDAYEDLWITLSLSDQRQVVDDAIIRPDAALKYSFCPRGRAPVEYFPRLRLQTGSRIVSEEDGKVSWRDEHSAPFSFMTRSQLNLSLSGAEPAARTSPRKPAEGFLDPPSVVLGGSSTRDSPPPAGFLTRLRNKSAVLKIQALGRPGDRQPLISPGSMAPEIVPGAAPGVEARPGNAKAAAPKPTEPKAASVQGAGPQPDDSKPVRAKPDDSKPVGAKPDAPVHVDSKPTITKPVGVKPAESKVTTAKPTESKITTAKPAESKITTGRLAESKITTGKPAESKITTGKPAESKITTAKLAESKITTGKPAESKITTGKPAESKITTGKLAESKITTGKPAESKIMTGKPAESKITTAKPTEPKLTAPKGPRGADPRGLSPKRKPRTPPPPPPGVRDPERARLLPPSPDEPPPPPPGADDMEGARLAALQANLSLESLQEFHSALNSPTGSCTSLPKTGFDFLDNW